MRALAWSLVAAWIALAGPAGAAPLQTRTITALGASQGGTIADDGAHRIAWGITTSLSPPRWAARVLDVRTGAIRSLTAPDGCAFAGLAGDGVLLWTCSRPDAAGFLEDLAAGTRTPLAAVAPPAGTVPDFSAYAGVGRAWLRFLFAGHHYAFSVYVNRADGRVLRPSRRLRNRRIDPDRSSLAVRLCSGMQLPLVPDDESGAGLVPGPLAVAGRRAAAVEYTDSPDGPQGRVVLERCGHKPRTLMHCRQSTSCTQPVISGRIVAWTREWPGHPVRVFVRSLRTGETRTLLLPAEGVALRLVGGRLLYTDARTLGDIGY